MELDQDMLMSAQIGRPILLLLKHPDVRNYHSCLACISPHWARKLLKTNVFVNSWSPDGLRQFSTTITRNRFALLLDHSTFKGGDPHSQRNARVQEMPWITHFRKSTRVLGFKTSNSHTQIRARRCDTLCPARSLSQYSSWEGTSLIFHDCHAMTSSERWNSVLRNNQRQVGQSERNQRKKRKRFVSLSWSKLNSFV